MAHAFTSHTCDNAVQNLLFHFNWRYGSRLSGQKELVLAPEFGVGSHPVKFAPYDCVTSCRD